MKIAGFIKTSFIDYPDKICTTVFTNGCNMNCWYCHNYELLDKVDKDYTEEVFSYLKERQGLVDAVTISGGEPTIQKGLEEFIIKVKELGFLIKLDTNGLNPNVLENLLNKNLLDYVAMDVKAPLLKYELVTRVKIDLEKIQKSIKLLKSSKIDYEFRTTFSPDLTLKDIEQIGELVKGAKNFSLQAYQKPKKEDSFFPEPLKKSIIEEAFKIILNYVPNAKLKGI